MNYEAGNEDLISEVHTLAVAMRQEFASEDASYFGGKTGQGGRKRPKPESREAVAQAEKVLAEVTIRQRLCVALASASDDVKEVAKIVCGTMVPLAIAGTLGVATTPLLLAGVTVVVLRAGIRGLCADNKKSTDAQGRD